MIEMMFVLLVLSIAGSLLIRPFDLSVPSLNAFESAVIHTQFAALRYHDVLTVKSEMLTEYPIRFNANGNVNMGQTIELGNRKLVILIGTGGIHEKSILDD